MRRGAGQTPTLRPVAFTADQSESEVSSLIIPRHETLIRDLKRILDELDSLDLPLAAIQVQTAIEAIKKASA